jgi:hypothetical protein
MRKFFLIFIAWPIYTEAQNAQGIYLGLHSNIGHTHTLQKEYYLNQPVQKYHSKAITAEYLLTLSFVKKNILNIEAGIAQIQHYKAKNNHLPYQKYNLKENSAVLKINYDLKLLNNNKPYNLYWSAGLTSNMLFKSGNRFYNLYNLPVIFEINTGLNYYTFFKKSFIKIGVFTRVNPYHSKFNVLECGTNLFYNEYFYPTNVILQHLSYGMNLAYSFKVAPNNKLYRHKSDYTGYNDSIVFNPKTNRNFIYTSFLPGRIAVGYERLLLKKSFLSISASGNFGFYYGDFSTEISNHYIFGNTRHKFDVALNSMLAFNSSDWLYIYPSVGYRFHSPVFFSFSLAPVFMHQQETNPIKKSAINYLGIKPIINFGFVF